VSTISIACVVNCRTWETLSRLNRAYDGKDTTYILDFANSAEDILNAFKTYYETATLEATTDPNVVYNLRAKLDAGGYYDDFEVDRVAKVEVDPKSKQSDLIAAIEPVANLLLTAFKAARKELEEAVTRKDAVGEQSAKDKVEALLLFKADMGAFQRLYTFLSQMFDYGNTELEKRFIFYKRLIPLLEFGREREGVDLSQIQLTHHKLKSGGKRDLTLGDGDAPKLPPLDESGSGAVQEKEKIRLEEIIERVNDLFDGDLSDEDQLIYVNHVLKGKLLQSEELVEQAGTNSKAQFANSPTLTKEFMDALIESHEAHSSMSTQAINSQKIRDGLLDILLGPGGLYEALRERAEQRPN
jgi:type I restriction enzyme R subunit